MYSKYSFTTTTVIKPMTAKSSIPQGTYETAFHAYVDSMSSKHQLATCVPIMVQKGKRANHFLRYYVQPPHL